MATFPLPRCNLLHKQLSRQFPGYRKYAQQRWSHSDIKALQTAFRDPSSPYHIPPGTKGPAHPEDHDVSDIDPAIPAQGRAELLRLGYDPSSFWEQPIVWGDLDSFQHVNNVRYLRFFESGRIKWMRSLGHEIGGPKKADDMVKGKGISLILRSVSLDYKRPVTYPDTLLIAHKPHTGALKSAPHTESGPSSTQLPPSALSRYKLAKTHFHCLAVAWSYSQRRIVTESDSVLVWYDYDKLAKCNPGEEALEALERRIILGIEASRGSQ
ncbi:HotDog domain-containing protein [Irpex rosettiformis]|uniref:HotDog domain-containing protein n=1 Tax=Irpex rosettiformis TaxID=378272 RepID=A0ACB8UAZ8_9APHY|nr:HotDog domain-containing protein [Irpex rosettiformis]